MNTETISWIAYLLFCSICSCKFVLPMYHTNEDIFSQLDGLANGKCKGLLLSQSLVENGHNMKYYTITSPDSKVLKKNKALLIFGEHPRELISSEFALYLIKTLCGEYSVYSNQTITSILNHNEIVLIPIVNEYGRKEVENGSYCLRRNENNVDLNRNWGSHWKLGNNQEKLYSGSSPFSEWETRAVKMISEMIKPDIFITTHSGIYAMFTPLAYKNTIDDPQLKKLVSITKALNSKYCDCIWGSLFNSLPYPAPGGSCDYMYEEMKIKYSFAFEIYDGNGTNKYFNDLFSSDTLLKVFDIAAPKMQFLQLGTRLRLEPIYQLKSNKKKSHLMCFLQEDTKITEDECFKRGNPQTVIQYDRVLINWTNIYFELFTMIYDIEHK